MHTDDITTDVLMQHEMEKIEDRIETMEKSVVGLEAVVSKYKKTLKDAVNELCYQCGQYKNEHLGACDGCRWKGLRSGDIE